MSLEGPKGSDYNASSPPPPQFEQKPTMESKAKILVNLTVDRSKGLYAKKHPALNKLSEFTSGVFKNYSDFKIGVAQRWNNIKIGVKEAPAKLKDIIIQTFPNVAKALFSGVKTDATGIQKLVEELAKNPLKKLRSRGEDTFYLTDREVGLPGKAGTSEESRKAMGHLLSYIEKSKIDPKKAMEDLRKSEWAKEVFKNDPDLFLRALKIEAKLSANTPEGARAMLEDLNKVVHNLNDENKKLRLEGNTLVNKERQGGKKPGQSVEAKLAVDAALIQLQEGIKGGGITREALAILKTLENSPWVQNVFENNPEFKVQLDAIKSDLKVQKEKQLEVLAILFQEVPEMLAIIETGFGEDFVANIAKESEGLSTEEIQKKVVLKILSSLADDEATLMPLEIFALGFNSVVPLEKLLHIVNDLLKTPNKLNDEQKHLLISFVREIDRLELNTAELNENKTVFQEITGQVPKTLKGDNVPPAADPEKEFEATLAKARNGDEMSMKDIELFAKTFESVSFDVFSKINGQELLEKDGGESCKQLAAASDQISYYVVDTILLSDNIEEARRSITFFIKIAKKCMEDNDFNSAFAIIAGVNKDSIHRLFKDDIPENKEIQERLAALDILSPDKNFANLRSHLGQLRNNGEDFIPFSGIYFTDFTFIRENPKIVTRMFLNSKPLEGFQHGINTARRKKTVNMASVFANMAKTEKINQKAQDLEIQAGDTNGKRYEISLKLKPRSP